MKALKITGIVLLSIIGLIVVIGLIAPTEYKVDRSITVNAPEENVYYGISTWEAFKVWSPWNKYDQNMTVTLEGEDGKVGSKYSWSGNSDAGVGNMIKTAVVPNKRIDIDLNFIEPFEGNDKTYFTMEPEGEGYKVNWVMEGKMTFPFNVMGLFMNMEEMIGKDYDEGLQNMKKMVEAMPVKPAFDIQTANMEAMQILFVSKECPSNEIGKYLGEAYGELMMFTKAAGIQVNGAPLAIYDSYTPEQTSMRPALPVASLPKKVSGKVNMTTLPAQQVVVCNYFGDYPGTEQAHYAIDEYIKSNKMEITGSPWEVYVTDPETEPDTAKWNTKIYYPVKSIAEPAM